ncbi:MAG: alpha/beta fold hydrolase [Christensenellales bacterium]
MKTIHFAAGNRQIRQLVLHEPQGEPRVVLHIVHGMSEHYQRYYPLAEQLCRQGFAVAGYDQIGHGPETPREELGYLGDHNGWQRLVYDVNTTHTILCQRWPDAKQVLLGNSMGSFVAREYVVQFGHERLDGLVLSGTGYTARGMCAFGVFMAEMVCWLRGPRRPSKFIDKIAFSGNNKPFAPARSPFDWLSRDAEAVDRYLADPYCGFVFTGGGYRDLLGGLKLLTQVERLNAVPKSLPVLFLSGEKDPVGGEGLTGVKVVAAQYRSAGIRDVTVKTYPEARHELFHEINREEVMTDLVSWLARL